MAEKILLVDDDPVQRRLLDAMMTKLGHKTIQCDGGVAAVEALGKAKPGEIALVFLDLMMPDLDGMAVLEKMSERGISVPVIVQTAQGGIETAVEAMRAGAFDFVVKPVSPERVKVSITNALKVGALQSEIKRISRSQSGQLTFDDIITSSPAMENVVKIGKRAAGSNIPVLIEGESGVGKEMVARAIQGMSERRAKPFVTVNCGALPENLVESILFGHEKGAFTGANDKHIGKFEEANGGTLFLDEVGELPLDIQVKLLRAIQEGEVDPIGARKPVKVDIRLISATNKNLLEEVKAGRFREDLFYRLNVFPMTIPPLRVRRPEIPALLRHFITRFAAEENRTGIRSIRADAVDVLSQYDWPGNIRQLQNAVFRAVVLCDGDELTLGEFPQIAVQVGAVEADGTIVAKQPQSIDSDLAVASVEAAPPLQMSMPEGDAASVEPPTGQQDVMASNALSLVDGSGEMLTLEKLERKVIAYALRHYEGKMSKIAKALGIGRSTLYRKMREYGLDEETSHEGGADPENEMIG